MAFHLGCCVSAVGPLHQLSHCFSIASLKRALYPVVWKLLTYVPYQKLQSNIALWFDPFLSCLVFPKSLRRFYVRNTCKLVLFLVFFLKLIKANLLIFQTQAKVPLQHWPPFLYMFFAISMFTLMGSELPQLICLMLLISTESLTLLSLMRAASSKFQNKSLFCF